MVAVGTDADHGHFAARKPFYGGDVILCSIGQLVVFFNVRDVLCPAVEFLVYRRATLEQRDVGGEVVHNFAAAHIVRGDLEFFEPRQRVEFIYRERRQTVNAHGEPQYYGVEPTATPRSARSSAELVPDVEQVFAYFVVKLGRERTSADARRVRLGYAETFVYRRRSYSRASAEPARDRVRACDERVSAAVEVEQSALRALEYDALVRFDRVVEYNAGVHAEPFETFRVAVVLVEHGFVVDRFAAVYGGYYFVFEFEIALELLREQFGIDQIDHANTDAVAFVGIARTDAALGSADGVFALCKLGKLVYLLVVRHDHVRAQIDQKLVELDAERFERTHFFEHHFRIDYYAVAYDIYGVGVEYTARYEMQFVRFAAAHHRVSRIAAARRADNVVRGLRENVDYFSFSFVAPLCADKCCCVHISS